MDERVLWDLSAVLLMALTQVLLLGTLEGLLTGVLLGFWLFKRWKWRLLLPLAPLLFAAMLLPLALRPPARPGVAALARCSMAGSSGGWCPSWTGSRRCLFCSGRPPKLAWRRPLWQLSELLSLRPWPALSLAVGAVGTVKRFPGPGSRWPLGNIRNGKMPL